MDFYVAKDCDGIGFFKDEPDLVKFSLTDPIVWEGYPVDFGDFTQIRDLVAQHLLTCLQWHEPYYARSDLP